MQKISCTGKPDPLQVIIDTLRKLYAARACALFTMENFVMS